MSEYRPIPHPDPSPALEDIYTFGYSPTAVQILTSRTAEDSARFFLPYFTEGRGCWIAAGWEHYRGLSPSRHPWRGGRYRRGALTDRLRTDLCRRAWHCECPL